jgi:hypothetical protein
VIGQSFFALNGLATMTAGAEELRAISVADGYVQSNQVLNLILDEKTALLPILLGYNADEGSLFYRWDQKAIRMNHEFPTRLARFREVFSDDAEVSIKAYRLDNP